MRHCRICGYWCHTMTCDRCNRSVAYTYNGSNAEFELARIQALKEAGIDVTYRQPDGGLLPLLGLGREARGAA